MPGSVFAKYVFDRPIFHRLSRFPTNCARWADAIDGRITRVILWLAVAAFLAFFANWSLHTGLRVRDDAWRFSRSIRYHGDIRNAVRWGGEVVEDARTDAKLPDNASPGIYQLLRAEGRMYDDHAQDPNGGLDYPPLRLLTMSIFVREVQKTYPGLSEWPGPWRLGQHPNEDIAAPLVRLNTLFTGLSAILVFLLVWLWMYRGGRAGTLPRRSLLGPRRPRWRTATPLRDSIGLLIFPPLICVLYYAFLVAVSTAPAPPPSVQFDGPPQVQRNGNTFSAVISATINSQGASTQWSVDWGTQAGVYPHSVRGNDIGDDGSPNDVNVTLPDLPDSAQIHYRISARNDADANDFGRGITRTDDALLLTGDNVKSEPIPPGAAYGEVWLGLWQWLGIAGVFAAVCGAIRLLPIEHRGWACGLLAAMLVWLNPAALVDGNCWPQWDLWLLPPFLLTLLLASLDWWFTAGIVFAVGAMFKGQFLIGAPVLLFWPLLSMRWGALARMLCGMVIASALILGTWVALGNQPFDWSLPPVRWILRIAGAVVIASIFPLMRRPLVGLFDSLWNHKSDITLKRLGIICGIVAIVVATMVALVGARWPRDALLGPGWGLLLFVVILLPPWLLRRRWLGFYAAAIIGISIWMCAWLYDGDWSWETVGFEYGTVKFDRINMGMGANGNLSSILAIRFAWNLHDPAITLHLPNLTGYLPTTWLTAAGLDGYPLTLDLRQLLISIFAAAMVACAIGAGINDRRNHPRFLAAMVAPWMLMPNILGQMMCRYQLWGAVLSALLIGVSPAFAIVCVIDSLLAAGMVGRQLLDFDPSRSPQLNRILTTLAPDHGWIMLSMAALTLCIALMPGQRSSENPLPALPIPPVDKEPEEPDSQKARSTPPTIAGPAAPIASMPTAAPFTPEPIPLKPIPAVEAPVVVASPSSEPAESQISI